MTAWFYKKLSWFTGCLAVAFLFGLIVLASNLEIKDMDLWLHLAAGRYISQTFSIPHFDIFSCTITNAPWVNHEWLFQIFVHYIYSAGGIEGLVTLKTVTVFSCFVILLFLGYTRERPFWPVFTLLLVVLVYQLRMTLRPDMFSLLFLTLYVSIIGLYLDRRWALWAIALIQIVWTNTHGFFIIGPGLLLTAWASEWLKRNTSLPFEWNTVNRLTEREYAQIKRVFFVAVLACLVNPFFVQGAVYPFKVLFSLGGESQVFFRHIQELQRPLHWGTLFSLQPYLAYKLMILVSFFAFVFNFKKIDINSLALWCIFLVFSLNALRNLIFFAFVAYFTFLANFQHISLKDIFSFKGDHEKWAAFLSAVLNVCVVLWIVQYGNSLLLRGYYDFDRFERKSEYGGVSQRNFPVKAADFLVDNGIKGNFFNDFNSGAYLLGRAYPNIKVFIDGRTEVYGADMFGLQDKIWQGDTALFEDAAEKYQLTGAFLNAVYVPAPQKMIHYLYHHPQWVLVYFDYDAAVFLRDIPQNREWIDKYRIDLARWTVPDAGLLKIGTHKVTPYRPVNRAYALYNMGFPEKAGEEARQALRVEPYNVKANKLLGKIYNEQGQYALGFEYLRKAKLLDPQDMKIRYQMAWALYHLGEMEKAKEQCLRVLSQKPGDEESLSLLSLIEGGKEGKL